ncbi:hypothetical protein CLOM_g16198 [Closterium sp. NIES-68]|nr:hypothetical protein CLOM_g16198 [Closterium sp. NIES-68]
MHSILEMLLKNLDKKAKQYKDSSLGCVFLMNNVHHIVQQIQRWELQGVIGEVWVQQKNVSVQQLASAYRRAAWSKVVHFRFLNVVTAYSDVTLSAGIQHFIT